MNLPSYIDLDQEYFKGRAKVEAQAGMGIREHDALLYTEAFTDWSDYQKFFHQTVFEGMFVPCSVKLILDEMKEYDTLDQYNKCKEAYEQSGKPLVKPENYDEDFVGAANIDTLLLINELGVSIDWVNDCKQYHEAEQRKLFTGWEKGNDKSKITYVVRLRGNRIYFLDGEIFIGSRSIGNASLNKLQNELDFPLPLNESNKTIQKLFLSEVKV